ncbi:MAG: class I SAM-dependent methyltransferase [Thermoplasmata archaeon]|nr:class I SAM-dependent methyltransferase [Thermoplasmata archaeon]
MAVLPVAAEGFTAAVAEYERARPGYPPEAIRRLVEELELSPAARLLELAAGTGKFTAALLDTGLHPVAVEPLARFREPLRRKFPRVPLVAALAERLPFRDGKFDAVFAAQAFHWFASALALPELHRVLRPGGGLGLVWNVRDDAHPLFAGMTRLLEEVNPGVPSHRHERWRRALEEDPGFAPVEEFTLSFLRESDLADLVDRVASVSFVARLPEGEKKALLDRVRALGAADPDLARTGRVELPYRTEVYWTRALPANATRD